MKCDTCKHQLYHSGGSGRDVAEGYDDPYSYAYCVKGHWAGEDQLEPEPGEPEDAWENCKDYNILKIKDTEFKA